MKITADTPEANLGGLQANNFQLTNSAKIIDIVINKMYSNKPGAVIRELGSNAWDAHVANGNQDKPFDIDLPTWLNKTFSIRDYGTGIPHDKFEFIYTNIGGSTKEATNDFIGGFGLGSKTPFTMVTSFTVENWYGGSKTTWLCFKDAGEPKVTLLSTEASDEPSGVRVSFVFEDGDVPEFTKQLTKQLRYFPVRPNVTGGEGTIEWVELPDGWETQDYFYTTARQDNHGYYLASNHHSVVMGNVCYDLNQNEIDHKYRGLFHKSLTLKVPIGAVDIPPSREHLEYTAKTKKFLNDKLAQIYQEYKDDFLKDIDDNTSWLDLRKKFYQANNSLLNISKYTHKDVEYSYNHLSNSMLTARDHSFLVKTIISRYSNVYRKAHIRMSDVCDGTLTLLVNDLGIGGNTHINAEYQNIPDGAYIIEPLAGPRKELDGRVQKVTKEIEEFFGIKPELLSSHIGSVPVKAVNTNRAKPDQIFRLQHVIQQNSTKKVLTSVDTIPTDGYMIPMKAWDAEGDFQGKLCNLANFADVLEPIYLVRKHTRKDCTALKGTDELQQHIDAVLTPIVKSYKQTDKLQSLLPASEMGPLMKLDWKGVDNVLHLAVKYYKRLIKLQKGSWQEERRARSLISKVPEGEPFISTRAQALVDEYNRKYSPLMESLTYGWRTEKNFESLHKFLQENK